MRALPVIVAVLFVGDAPAHALAPVRLGVETPLTAAARPARVASWAESLAPVEVTCLATRESATIRLYARDGEVDPQARAEFERVVAGENDAHPLAERLEQLVVKAAYHFGKTHVLVVSGWRENAGRHSSGEALDFKLDGVRASQLAAYLRGLPRVGVGIYTHPRTQYVHLDVREPSYHWLDASPPGVHRKERQLRDPKAAARDASWTPESDLPF
jgi:uncharacterized protein YcbK (DUF882 family)